MVKKILFAVVILIAAILIYAVTRPNDFRVQRTMAINASPEKIVGLIQDFHQWGAWSPYEKLDPGMTRNYGGSSNGTGAVYEWKGDSKAGAGKMEIIETAPSKVVIKLDFIAPFEGHDIAEFTLDGTGETTNVTWAMSGPSPYVAKLMGIFFNMDQLIGKDFEAGLANMKGIAESSREK